MLTAKNSKLQKLICKPNYLTSLFDLLLKPFMFVLNGFKTPIQETHAWHTQNFDPSRFKDYRGIKVDSEDVTAKYTHGSPLGLFHMPLFGGLTKYVVLEASNFKDHWHIAWKGGKNAQIHKLKIKNKYIKLLTGKGAYQAFAVNDDQKFLPIKIVDYGEIGDGKYLGVKLF